MQDYLMDIFNLENPMVLDDEMSDAFDSWIAKKVDEFGLVVADDSDGITELYQYYSKKDVAQ